MLKTCKDKQNTLLNITKISYYQPLTQTYLWKNVLPLTDQ